MGNMCKRKKNVWYMCGGYCVLQVRNDGERVRSEGPLAYANLNGFRCFHLILPNHAVLHVTGRNGGALCTLQVNPEGHITLLQQHQSTGTATTSSLDALFTGT